MNTKLLILQTFLLLVCTFPTRAQTSTKTAPPELTPSQMLADFDALRSALTEAHGGLYRFQDKATVNKLFDETRAKVARAVSRRELIPLLSQMLAVLGDGHMRLEYDKATTAALTAAPVLPFSVLIEKDRLMVLYNESRSDSIIRPGMEIVSINGQSPAELFKKVLPAYCGDGFIETGKLRRLERRFSQAYWLFVDPTSQFNITARGAGGKIYQAALAGVPDAERENNRKNNPVNKVITATMERLDGDPQNISLRFLDGNVARLRIRGFDGDDFTAQLDAAFATLYDKKTRALILDLRGNGGGVDEYGAYLVAQFMDQPFRYFDRIHVPTISPSFTTWKEGTTEHLRNGVDSDAAGGYLVKPVLHSGVGLQKPGKHPFRGTTYVLIDGLTFSTAADVTAVLRNAKRAVFIGEETGGAYEGNTSGLNAQVNLLNSGMRVRIHLYEYFNAVSGGNRGRGTLPDYAVEKRISDLLQGIDLPLNKATNLAGTNK